MTKVDATNTAQLARRVGLRKEEVEAVLKAILDELILGRIVRLSGFGQFAVGQGPKRMAVSPLTGDEVDLGGLRFKFAASKTAKAYLRGDRGYWP